ncbi:MAG: PTS sugar transporter subunit IIA [Brevinema sp.]
MYLLDKSCIEIIESLSSWKEGVRKSVKLLENKGFVTETYLDAIYDNIDKFGPYIVLSSDLIMPHARPDQGALKNGISVLKVNNGINFFNNNIKIILSLSAIDSDMHIDYIKQIVYVINKDDSYQKLLEATDIDTIYQLFQKSEEIV